MSPVPPCIRCGRKKTVVRIADTFKCNACGVLFDNDPDEGGTHGNNPAARIEREERRRDGQRNRLGERRHG